MTKTKTLKGGSFNLKYGRPAKTVKAEVEGLLQKHNLDFLTIQEGTDYFSQLRDIRGYKYFATRAYRGGAECGILVKECIKTGKPNYGSFGDGWITVRGGHHPPVTFPRVTIDGWLKVGSIHLPTPSTWTNGKFWAPEERKDDYLAVARQILKFFKTNKRARLIAGDWNEPPATLGEWSPGWLAKRTGAKIIATESKAGHGRIDYPMFKNVEVRNVYKDLKIAEGSDHEPVIFTVVKP